MTGRGLLLNVSYFAMLVDEGIDDGELDASSRDFSSVVFANPGPLLFDSFGVFLNPYFIPIATFLI